MRCPKCDNKESRLLEVFNLRGEADSISGTSLSKALLDQAAAQKGQLDPSQVYCTWCGNLVYEDTKE